MTVTLSIFKYPNVNPRVMKTAQIEISGKSYQWIVSNLLKLGDGEF